MKRILITLLLSVLVLAANAADVKVRYAHRKHESVDLGLSVLWATTNVGAKNPQDYGNYFAFGETEPKEMFTEWNFRFGSQGIRLTERYDSTRFDKYGTTVLDAVDDAAAANWGKGWRMPTKAEKEELLGCNWEWMTVDGVYGARITSNVPGYEGRSIFIPASGFMDGNEPVDVGERVVLWTSNLFRYGTTLHYGNKSEKLENEPRLTVFYGMTVRPVRPLKDSGLESISIDAGSGPLLVGGKRVIKFNTTPMRSIWPEKIIWSSSDTNIVRITAPGEIMGVGEGSCSVTAQYGSMTAHCNVAVEYVDPVAVDLGLSVQWAAMNVGASDLNDIGSLFKWDQLQWLQCYMERGWRLPTRDDFAELERDCDGEEFENDDEEDVLGGFMCGLSPGYEKDTIYFWFPSSYVDDNDSPDYPFFFQADERMQEYEIESLKRFDLPVRLIRDLPQDEHKRPYYVSILTKDSICIEPGERRVLQIHAQPGNIKDAKAVEWSTSDPRVATVQDGVITAISAGTCTVTASFGDASAYYHLQVAKTGSSLSAYKYVDLGLSVCWASFNLGSLTEDDNGERYFWGDVLPDYDIWYDYDYDADWADAAAFNWGGSWRVPSREEWEELAENCEWEMDTVGVTPGFRATSKVPGYEGKSIFLPYPHHGATYNMYMTSDLVQTNRENKNCYSFYITDTPRTVYIQGKDGPGERFNEYSYIIQRDRTYKYSVRAVRPKK